MKTNLRIGEVLMERGYITSDQMDKALAYQKEHRDKRVGQILIELGFVTESQVLEALAQRLGLDIVAIGSLTPDLTATALIPRELAERQNLLAVGFEGEQLVVVTNDPLNYFALEEVRQLTGKETLVRLSELTPLQKAIAYYYAEVGAREAANKANLGAANAEAEYVQLEESENGDMEAPIVKLLNSLLDRAISTGASDIHIEPFEKNTRVRMRLDGVIVEYVTLERSIHQPLIARIKIMSGLDIAERRLPQDGHFRIRVNGSFVNIRVSILPTVFGEKAVLRVLASAGAIDHAAHFGMDDDSYARFLPMLNSPNGIIYITGPTGSGKSTTLYMVLEYLSHRPVNISTIEDPVEKNVPTVNQTQVNPVAGMTFENGLRALLRQDPDIIMVGETRDGETASISVRAAITGHIVLSTLHTNDAISSIVRLADMGLDRYLIANSLVGIVAQRLMRKVCPHCARKMAATPAEKQLLGKDVEFVTRGTGCTQCSGTGYRGRIAIHEIVSIDREMRRMISRGAEVDELEEYAKRTQNMQFLRDKGVALVREGVTTPEELVKVAYYA